LKKRPAGPPREDTGRHETRASAPKRGARVGPTQRQLRVAEEVRHVLAGIFARQEFRDPDLAAAEITVTEVRMTPDLRHGFVYVARLGRSDITGLLPALTRASAYLRGQVAKAMRLRVAPDLTFHADEALEYASKIDILMHQPVVARDLGKE